MAVKREERVFERLIGIDPTPGKFAGWLSVWRRRSWPEKGLATGVGLSELRAVRHALEQFVEASPYLPTRSRDIGKFRTIEEVRDAAGEIPPSGMRNMRMKTRQDARRQTTHLYDDGTWTVLRLDGPSAARQWGWGTRWCTATSEDSYRRYTLAGDLVVLITPAGKFQLGTASMEFRDEADRDADLQGVLSKAPTGFADAVFSMNEQARGKAHR